MTFRTVRRLFAGAVAATAAALTPAAAIAGITVSVEQYNLSSGTTIGSTYSFSAAPSSTGRVAFELGAGWAGNGATTYFTGDISVRTNSVFALGDASLNTVFNGSTTDVFDSNVGLRLVVTDNGFVAPTGAPFANLTSATGASNAFQQLNQGQFPTVSVNTTNQTTVLPNSGTPTSTTTVSDVNPGSTGRGFTSMVVSTPLTGYSIRQTISLFTTRNPTNGDVIRQSFGGTFGSSLAPNPNLDPGPNPVPAPAGLVLALTALPVFGARRLWRKTAQAD